MECNVVVWHNVEGTRGSQFAGVENPATRASACQEEDSARTCITNLRTDGCLSNLLKATGRKTDRQRPHTSCPQQCVDVRALLEEGDAAPSKLRNVGLRSIASRRHAFHATRESWEARCKQAANHRQVLDLFYFDQLARQSERIRLTVPGPNLI